MTPEQAKHAAIAVAQNATPENIGDGLPRYANTTSGYMGFKQVSFMFRSNDPFCGLYHRRDVVEAAILSAFEMGKTESPPVVAAEGRYAVLLHILDQGRAFFLDSNPGGDTLPNEPGTREKVLAANAWYETTWAKDKTTREVVRILPDGEHEAAIAEAERRGAERERKRIQRDLYGQIEVWSAKSGVNGQVYDAVREALSKAATAAGKGCAASPVAEYVLASTAAAEREAAVKEGEARAASAFASAAQEAARLWHKYDLPDEDAEKLAARIEGTIDGQARFLGEERDALETERDALRRERDALASVVGAAVALLGQMPAAQSVGSPPWTQAYDMLREALAAAKGVG